MSVPAAQSATEDRRRAPGAGVVVPGGSPERQERDGRQSGVLRVQTQPRRHAPDDADRLQQRPDVARADRHDQGGADRRIERSRPADANQADHDACHDGAVEQLLLRANGAVHELLLMENTTMSRLSSAAKDEKGIALVATVLALILLTAVGMARMFASNMETMINASTVATSAM